MFFNLHKDTVIGYKKLSEADLGTSQTSNQTHIGLYEETLNFITNYQQESSAQLIYESKIYETISLLDPIRNPNGTFRSPKIRMGTLNELQDKKLDSLGKAIRDIASFENTNSWYILWFGLENEELVFILFQEGSTDYNYFIKFLGNLNKGTLLRSHPIFEKIISYLNTKVNTLNFSYIEKLELLAQTQQFDLLNRIKPKRYDIDKAQQLFQKIGREGEELVNIYLNKEKHNNQIKNFNWVNKNGESGFPFDFEIQTNDGNLIYSDAKSTSYKFEQKMIFSSQELKFIHQNPNYHIHRVFNLNETPQLKICNNIETISHNFIKNLNKFNTLVENDNLKINGIKISVKPTLSSLNFEKIINL